MINNADRVFVKILREICEEEGVSLYMTSCDWMGRLEKNGKTGFVWGYQLPENSAAAHLIAKDKSGISQFLQRAGVPCVPHELFITPKEFGYLNVSSNWDRMRELLTRYGKVVVKPNEGTGGDCVYLATTFGELEEAVTRVFDCYRTVAISPFIEIEAEYRAVVSGNSVKLIFSKIRPEVVGDGVHTLSALGAEKYKSAAITYDCDPSFVPKKGERVLLSWHHNLGRGAYAEVVTDGALTKQITEIALAAAAAVGVTFASVDVIKTQNGFSVLEINSGVMTENFARESEENYRTAKEIYREAVLRYFAQ